MKTLLFTIEYPPFAGGVANYYENIVKHWPSNNGIYVLHNNENCLIKNYIRPKWLPAIFKLLQNIKSYKIDHVLVGHILPLGTVAFLLSKFLKFKYSIIIHGMDFTFAIKNSRKKRISRKILLGADNVICSNSYVAQMVKDFLGDERASKVFVVNPGIDIKKKPNQELISRLKENRHLTGKIVLLSLGRLVKRKGVDKVLDAMPEVLKSFPDLYYVIIGEGPDKIYLKEKAKGVKNVIFAKAEGEEKWTWLAACDIFIMPSRNIDGDFEGFGIVYLEANLMGKPVIAGEAGGVSDAVQGAISGIMVDGENTERIAGAIISLAGDEELRKKLGDQGRERAIGEFNWENQVNKIYNIINVNS